MTTSSRFVGFCALLVLGALSALPVLASPPVATIPAEALISKLQWRCVGPYIGGRVVAVTGVREDADLFYMGAVDGGIWKSTDYGLQWKNISDGKLPGSSASIGAIAVASSNPAIIYAGTGESDIRGDMITGDGVFKSTDAGKTWRYAGLRETHTISGIAIDPENPNIVYASSMGHVFKPDPERGVFKTTDGGKTWHKILFVDDRTGAIDLAMDPSNPQTLYAATWQAYRTPWSLSSGGPGSGIYKTTDGGAHWTNLSHNPGFPAGVLGRIGVAVAASQPDVVYAIVQAKHGGVFRSSDGGQNWQCVNKEWMLRQRAFYYMTVYVDPKDPDTVYAPQVDALWASRDGGKTFKKLRTPHGDNHALWINPDDPKVMVEGNDGGATVTTDGGKSWSNEHNQPTGQFYHVNLDDQFPFHIYGAQQDEGSFEGPSAASSRTIPLSAWHRAAYGESTFSVPQPGNPNITYGSGYFSIFLKYDMATGQYEEISPWPDYQEGASSGELKYRFAWTHPILFAPIKPKSIGPIEVQLHSYELLIGCQYVFKSVDDGRTWKRISPDLTRNAASTEAPTGGPINLDQSGAEIYPSLSALAVSPLDSKTIWAGSDDGLVHVTTDGGKHWQAVRPPSLPAQCEISSIEPSHTAEGTAYLTAQRYMWDDFQPYVYETTDYGQHWKNIVVGLPQDQYAFVIRQDPSEANLLFLGTKSTVYVSLDGGAQWQPITLNLPRGVQVRDIRINGRQGDVVIATHGRSFWILDNLALLEQLAKSPAIQSDSAYVFGPQEAWLTHAYGRPESGAVKPINAGTNPPFGATVFFHIPANYDGQTPATLTFLNANGQTIRSFRLHLEARNPPKSSNAAASEEPSAQKIREAEKKLTGIEPGMNRFQWDLRYPNATEVEGFHAPIAAGGLPDSVEGPRVTPGEYSVVLDYGGHRMQQELHVALDPRLDASQAALAARLALALQIHTALDTLDKTINRAIAARRALKAAVSQHRLTEAQAAPALEALSDAIGIVVQLGIQSSEGSLVHETKLHSQLAYLAADLDLAYAKPTPAEESVFRYLAGQARRGEQILDSATTGAEKLLGR
jgi:photosystem II stability/assembly factor-like uncharacterized protein